MPSRLAAHLAPCTLALVAPFLPAQALEGGDYVVVDYGTLTLHRMTDGGAVSNLHVGPPLTSPAGVAVDHNGDVYVSDYSQNAIYRVPRVGVVTLVTNQARTPIRIALDHDRSILVASLTTQALLRVTPTGQVSTVAQGTPLNRVYDVAVDHDGTYVVVEEGGGAVLPGLHRVTRTGVVTPIWQGLPLRLPHGVALLHDGDYAVIDGIVDAVFRVPRNGAPPTVMTGVPNIINPDSLCSDFAGGVMLAQELASGRRVDHVDRFGAVTSILNPAPFQNVEAIARAPRLTGPVQGGAGQTSTFNLEFGGEGNAPYVLWASLSTGPGFGLSPPDVRAVATNPDSLFFLSIGANDPVFVGWAGALSAAGTAAPQLAVPNLALPPLTFYLQALTVSFRSPSGVRSLANVWPLRL
jgi:sugar lactone lactonase YvrE